jgi:HEAT repeat protein
LKQYDWGTDIAVVAPIDRAVAESHGNASVRDDLEQRLLAALRSDIPRDAKDYVCRKLAIVGSAASVPTLAALLPEANHSHMARFALERIPAPEAGQALRDALSKVTGDLQIGVLSSIGARRDAAAVSRLGELLKDNNAAVGRAAAIALGDIGNVEAVSMLQASVPSASASNPAVNDALLTCAEALLAGNQQADALTIYKRLAGDGQNRLVRLAATRGMLACMGKQA